jgi:hypothetical protein
MPSGWPSAQALLEEKSVGFFSIDTDVIQSHAYKFFCGVLRALPLRKVGFNYRGSSGSAQALGMLSKNIRDGSSLSYARQMDCFPVCHHHKSQIYLTKNAPS